MDPMNNIVSLKQANIYQGNSLVLNNVNLDVDKGEFIYMIGKTGSGKSSLLKTLYGEIYLKEGEGNVAAFDLKDLTWQKIPLLRRNLGIVFQDFRLATANRDVYDNLEICAESYRVERQGIDEGKNRKCTLQSRAEK